MNTLQPAQIEALSRIPSLKGAPLSIVVVMLIAQQPLQAHELQTYSGLGNGAVTDGLRKLTNLRAVIDLGRRGWILSPNWQQLTLPLQFLGANVNHENRDLDHDFRDLPNLVVSSGYIDPKTREDLTTNQPDNHENRDLPSPGDDDPENTAITHWLRLGGIVANTPKMRLLVEKVPSEEYAKAHVLEFLHERRSWEKSGKRDREPGTGALIYRLERGWLAPAMRCEECLSLEKECHCSGRELRQRIPNQYIDVITR